MSSAVFELFDALLRLGLLVAGMYEDYRGNTQQAILFLVMFVAVKLSHPWKEASK